MQSEAARYPSFKRKPVLNWSCENGVVAFAVGRWVGILHGGPWGFARSEQELKVLQFGGSETFSVRHIDDSWWIWFQDE